MEKHQEIDAAAASPARAKPMHTSEFFNDPPRLKKGVIPNYVFDSIGKPSLLDTEVVAEYDALFFRLVETIDPDIAVEWMWVADLAHIVWEMRRVRGVRNGIVERETASALGEVVWDILSGDYDREKW